jgi:hypothetical protein
MTSGAKGMDVGRTWRYIVSNLSIDPTLSALSASQFNLSSLNPTQGITGIQGLQASQAGVQALDSGGDSDGSVGPAATTQISRQGQLFSQLQQLQTQDPAKFKQVLTDVANQLTTAAQGATGKDQQFLSNLADKFTKAAGGDLTALQPPSQSASTSAISAYQQAAQASSNGQPVDPLAQAAAQNSTTDQSQTAGTAPTGGHHHHHGGHGKLSASTQQTLQSVFQELNSALGGSSSTATGGTSPSSAIPVSS